MEHLVELGGVVTGFHVTEHCIDCMCGKDLLKIDKQSGEIICQKKVFGKEGLSRKLTADDEQIYIYANQELKRGRKTTQKSRECKDVANKSHQALLRCLRQ